jgi:hypothetical protein
VALAVVMSTVPPGEADGAAAAAGETAGRVTGQLVALGLLALVVSVAVRGARALDRRRRHSPPQA